MDLKVDVNAIKGFLDPAEGKALHDVCLAACTVGPCLEIGSYCGKSTVYLGAACRLAGRTLFAVDHHQGSEEHQVGQEYHDPDLFDKGTGQVDTFRVFRQTLAVAGLLDVVVPVVAASAVVARDWRTPLGMVFIDGGHSLEAALTDYECWARHILPGGILAIHDLFPDPAQGGQAPITIYRMAIASGLFEEVALVVTLGILRRRQG